MKKKFSAGKMDSTTRSDCLVEFEPMTRGGIKLELESKVKTLFGDSIKRGLLEACSVLGVRHGAFRIIDQGALPYVISARVESAIRRADPANKKQYLPRASKNLHTPSAKDRFRRSRLYLPGNEPKLFPNAGMHKPDAIILDLEDSVAPPDKDTARLLVRNALRFGRFYGAERMVRINQGSLGIEDLHEIVPQQPDVIVIPKCEEADVVRTIDSVITSLTKESGWKIFLLPIIESARGVVNAYAIASASSRICALAIGLEDYTADIGVERTGIGRESFFARSAVVNAAKAAGVQALDSVYSDIDDLEGLGRAAVEAKSIGFDGMGCIHPRQIRVIHTSFAPTESEIERASAIVQAAKEARKSGSAVTVVGSKMVDAPVVKRAERILRLAELSAGRGKRE